MKIFKKIRTRFAPSPTGELHIGGVRTALFGYLFAKSKHGEWHLRIEDTDQARTIEGSVETIQQGLRWLGLSWDGEIVVQSKRTKIYQQAAEQLWKRGKAYRCFCTESRLKKMRDQQAAEHLAPKYDRTCFTLSPEAINEKINAKQPFVVRMKIPEEGRTSFRDLIHGEVFFHYRDLDDQILLKSDGFPTYHLANVIDDHDTKISHVIRGEEWLPSTPKHILLYQAFGWPVPEFAHLPLILNANRSKMSKRKDGELVWLSTYRTLGYLPEAMINFLALLGWNPKDKREMFSLDELLKFFKLEQVHKAGAVFSRERLDHMNAEYLRRLPLARLADLARPFFRNKGLANDVSDHYFLAVVGLEQTRTKILSELPSLTEYFFVDRVDLDPSELVWKKSDAKKTKEILTSLVEHLDHVKVEHWSQTSLEKDIMHWIQEQSLDNGSVLWPMRYALSGQKHSPGPFEISGVLGKEKTIQRLQTAKSVL